MAAETKRTLSSEEILLLALLKAALRGETLTEVKDVDWQRVFGMASEQHILPMIWESAWQCEGIPEPLRCAAENAGLQTVIRQSVRTHAFLELYRYLSGNGYTPLIVKGLVCRSLYPQPDQRPSSDEDLLIAPGDLSAVHELLTAYGLRTESGEAPAADADEITYIGQNQMRLELHTSLFPTDSEIYREMNRMFDGCFERAAELEIEGCSVHTLPAADHLLYLIFHACKHFFHSGVGIRQVCDIALMAEKWNSQIDWKQLRQNCEAVSMEVFAAGVFRIAADELGSFLPDVFADFLVDPTEMIADMLSGGVYGGTEENRHHSATVTVEAVIAQKEGRKTHGFLAAAFPNASSLARRYPYLEKRPWLLPMAWTQRLMKYNSMRRNRKGIDPSESLHISRQRLALLRTYGIID